MSAMISHRPTSHGSPGIICPPRFWTNSNWVSAEIAAGTTLQVGLHSAPGAREGYRLVADSQGEVQLVRLSARGTAIIDRAQANMRAGRAHELSWTRGRTGRMLVELDGRTVLDTRDREFEGGFAELSVSAEDGELAVRRVSVRSAAR